jgi:hypothetical protein
LWPARTYLDLLLHFILLAVNKEGKPMSSLCHVLDSWNTALLGRLAILSMDIFFLRHDGFLELLQLLLVRRRPGRRRFVVEARRRDVIQRTVPRNARE